ncbi:DUF397 domain-containing protein [Pseudonocardia sp. CNS-139]|nr:DUF397 domain-containing protein [Pseudonocardia sp. CNS-139]
MSPAEGQFRKSTFSNDHQGCVEVAVAADGARWVRDSKHPAAAPHRFAAAEWNAFLQGVKAGEFG